MSERPQNATEYRKVARHFHPWLVERGSAILKPTNPYGVARFLTSAGVGIVYRRESGALTRWVNGAAEAFVCFQGSKPWRATARGQRKTTAHERTVATLAARDGWGCLFCPAILTPETATIEHVLSITHGGSSHPANLALACDPCNQAASHLSVREKVELAIRGRQTLAERQAE